MSKMKYLPIIDLDQVANPSRQARHPETQDGLRNVSDRRAINGVLDAYALYGAALYPPLMHSLRGTPAGREVGFSRYHDGRMHGPGDAANEAGANDHRRVLPPLICDGAMPRSKVDSPSTASEEQDARAGWVKSVAAGVRRLWRHVRREREIARAVSLLSSLDDRTLHDIGLHRSQISYVARYGLDEPGRVRSHPS